MTPAEELRAAAARLREPASDELLVRLLDAREPLAGLLEYLAEDMAELRARVAVLPGSPRGVTVVLDDHGQIQHDWTATLATARALLGTTR